ncbi:unnamed protein product [Linum trigynum]|uniref:Uncharacterized protein n=1 Tax=Linum trigynum TaxID=586398 RepID=A0AAV2GBY8_9ROSI
MEEKICKGKRKLKKDREGGASKLVEKSHSPFPWWDKREAVSHYQTTNKAEGKDEQHQEDCRAKKCDGKKGRPQIPPTSLIGALHRAEV